MQVSSGRIWLVQVRSGQARPGEEVRSGQVVSGQVRLGQIIADALSKGQWKEAWPVMPMKNDDPSFIPRTLLRWLEDPVPNLELGTDLLREMSRYTSVMYLEK